MLVFTEDGAATKGVSVFQSDDHEALGQLYNLLREALGGQPVVLSIGQIGEAYWEINVWTRDHLIIEYCKGYAACFIATDMN